MTKRHYPKVGPCNECKRTLYLTWFKGEYICTRCLNPPEQKSIDEYATQSSPLGEAEDYALGKVGTARGKIYTPDTGRRVIVKDGERQ